jgi:serine phosphatase RsbU (regulator of sigma subunit)/CHASE2 domain-containing sensor protein
MTALKFASSNKLPARRVLLTWLVMTLIAVLFTLAVGDRMRRGVFDGWQSIRPRDLSATDVRVVLVDDKSIEAVGPWQWPRYYLARLTDELTERKARVIAFDIMFPEHDRVGPETFASLYPELSPAAVAEIRSMEPMDQSFGRAIGMGPVVLAHAGVDEAPPDQAALMDEPIAGPLPPKVEHWQAELAAIPELDDVALGHGLINVPPDKDGVVRSVPLVMRAGGKARPGFAAEIARNAVGAGAVISTPGGVRIGDRLVPADRRGRMYLHFGTFPRENTISAAGVIGKSRHIRADEFAGKIVLIGVTAEGSSDIAATPIAAQEFGPLVQAQAVDAILRAGWLVRPGWAGPAEWGAAALLSLLALAAAVLSRPYRFFLALIFALVPVVSWLAFTRAGMLLDPARPMLVGGGAVAGVALGLFALARIERERLRDALVQERLSAAEAEGELQAARAIQLGMVPPRERLRNLDPRVDLDALLEPARSIGGDYYDAMRIGDDQIGFAIADVTGKGVPAALFMAMSKALTSAALSRMQADPATMTAAINAELLKDNSEAMGVAILLGILDLATGEVRMVCAGHEDPLLLSPGSTAKRIRLEGGPPLCVTDYAYPLEELTLQPGETLLLVTDGVTEAQDPQGALFGRDRILAEPELTGASSTALVEMIRDRVRHFEEGLEATDDLTVMALRYLGTT